ncbi:fibropellin-1-like [Haliotis rubra]|uniref:fibropellin-1-like n=1 Tax=Haliotis rubra TaxID=36100 RepID=UPI001EE5306D|nr:fibropellin-1-like [Haliotis rubra]
MVREELLVFIIGFTMVCGSGRLSLRLLSFNNPGGRGSNGNYCDGFSFLKHSACDHQFTICLNSVYGSMDLSQCQYGRAVTGEVRDQDRITFRTDIGVSEPHCVSHYVISGASSLRCSDVSTIGLLLSMDLSQCQYGRAVTGEVRDQDRITFRTDIGGVRNPIVFRITSFPPKLRIKVGIWDVDSSNAHDFVDLLAKDTTLTPSHTEAGSLPVRLLIRRRSSLLVELRSYCDPNYYGKQCAVFCSASTKGRYTCHPYTGAKICTPGWHGMNCEMNVDDCVSSPCQNGATCIDKHRGYVCACAYGFTGERCETRINPCLSNPCSNGGLCEDTGRGYTCNCPVGWEGPRCAVDRDECTSHPCHHRGTCVDYPGAYECLCLNGFTGRLCEVNIDDCLSNSCINNSTCVDDVNDYRCACASGYTGRFCELNINECLSNPCANNATCVDNVNGYICTCAAGFSGKLCEENIDDCAINPCVNNGTCMDDVNSYRCACVTGFTGRSCEVNINECLSNPCTNNATCVDNVNGYICTCAAGFTGKFCEENIDDCAINPCGNNGRCMDDINSYRCACATGFTGRYCEVNINECLSNPCTNNATCVDDINGYRCTCASGFLGNNCELNVDECASAPCENGGTCSDGLNAFSCKCPDGYEGEYCENRSDPCNRNPCHNGGMCRTDITDFTCLCPSGYAGKLCETEDPCVSRPCWNGATCTDVGPTFTCSCVRGFTGPTCQVQINECASSPCLNNGTCVDLVDSVTCRCMEGYSGNFCQFDINECSSSPCLNNGTCMDKEGSFHCTCGEFYKGARCEILVPVSSVPENPQFSTQGITATSSFSATFSVSTSGLVDGDTGSSTASFTASTVTSSRAFTNAVDWSMDFGGSLKPTPGLEPSTDIGMTANMPTFKIKQTVYTTSETTSMIWPTLASSWTESLATSTVWTGSVSTSEETTAPPDSCFPLYLEGKLGTKEEDLFHEKLTHMLRNYADLTGNFSVSCQFVYFKDGKGGLVTEVTPVITVDGQLLDTSQMQAICQKIPIENLFDGFSHKMYLGSRFPMSTSSAQSGDQVLGMPVIVVIVIGTAVGLIITAVVVFVKYRRRCRHSKTATLNGDSDAFQHFENQLYMQPHTITVADRASSVD